MARSQVHDAMIAEVKELRHALFVREQQVAESLARAAGHTVGEKWVSRNGYRALATEIRYSFLEPYYSVYGVILRSNGTQTEKKIHLTDLFAGWRKE